MKNISSPKEAKIYKIKFTKTIIAVAIAVLLFCTIGIAFCIFRLVKFGIATPNDWLKYPFLLLVNLFCITIVTAVLVKSEYTIDKQYLTSKFGFIPSKYEIKKIESVVLDTNTYKLTIQCEKEFFQISLDKEWNEAFVQDLLSVNPNINYSFTFSEKKD